MPALSKAAIAAGADGLLVEVQCNPQEALSDATRFLRPDRFEEMMDDLRAVAAAVGMDAPIPSPLHV